MPTDQQNADASLKVGIVTSVSDKIADLAAVTVPNKLEYCFRHGYSLVIDNQPYEQATANMHLLLPYLSRFDLVWCLDCDALITNMTQPIHTLPGLGRHVTVCKEEIVNWNTINCGSVVYRATPSSRWVLKQVAQTYPVWTSFACGWQTWLGGIAQLYPHVVTVAPPRAFNSCVWNRPANARDEIGGYWQEGDLVYHPCGVFPPEERLKWITNILPRVIR
jgi:hypothetical protein